MLDLRGLLNAHHIPFVETGANVSSDSIGLSCPFCGDDPSQHLNLSVVEETLGWWFCWRDRAHRGRKPNYLLSKLLSKNKKEVELLLLEWGAEEAGKGDLQYFAQLNPNHLFGDARVTAIKDPLDADAVKWPAEFRSIHPKVGPYHEYLRHDRGFGNLTNSLVDYYALHYATQGLWAHRIIVPVFLDHKVVTWTARTVNNSPLRYRTIRTTPRDVDSPALRGEPISSVGIKSVLFNFDRLKGKVLVICEGPFDAMKIDLFGASRGVRATCLFGNAVSPSQLYALSYLSHFFNRVVIGWDNKGVFDDIIGLRLQENLRALGKIGLKSFLELPEGVEDPGDLSNGQAWDIVDGLAQ